MNQTAYSTPKTQTNPLYHANPSMSYAIDLVGTDRLSILNGLLEDTYDKPSVLDNWLVKYKYTANEIKNTDWYKKIPQYIRAGYRDLVDSKLNIVAKKNSELFNELVFFKNCEIASFCSVAENNYELYNSICDFIDKNPQFLNLKDKEHRSPLRIACFNKNAVFAELLIKMGADVNTINYAGNTIMPYLLVIFEKNGDSHAILDLLFDNGADMYIRNLKNMSLMQMACNCYEYDAVEYLLNRGYKIQEDERMSIINSFAETKNPQYVLPNHIDYIVYKENYDKILNLIKSIEI